MKNTFQLHLTNKSHVVVLMTALSLIIIISSYLFYKQQESSIRQHKYNELKAIADLKVNQIEAWIQEWRADARVVTKSDFLTVSAQNWLKDPSNVKLKTSIIERLRFIQSEYSCENIFLCTPDGTVQLSVVDTKFTQLDPFIKLKMTEAVEKGDIALTDLYYCPSENRTYYDIIAPVVTNKKRVIASIIFRIDPNSFLYPLIQTWPTPSKTAETAIIRVEQDSVVFLNELRHQKNTALKLKIPLTQTKVPAVQAALGRKGLFEGIDYRGVEVLSDIRVIPATNWIMLAKVDKSEIYSDLYVTAGVIAGIAFLIIIACSIGFVFIYNSRQKEIFKELYNKEKELWQQQERFKVTMESLGEGIITTDLNGKTQYLNKRAEELTGWHLTEAKGRMLSEIYRVKNEETGQIENNIPQKVLKHGIVKELANHTILITKSGNEIPVMDTGAPIFDIDGSVNGIVITVQDETEKRTQQKLLRESEHRLQEAQYLAKLGHWNLDMQTMTPGWSLETYRIHEVDPSVKPDLESAINFYAPEARPIVTEAINRCIKDGTPWDLELPFITAKGKHLWIRALGKGEFKDGKCVRLIGTFQDITERRELELQLQKSNERLNTLILQLNDVVWTALPDGSEIVDVSKSIESVYGITIEQYKANPKLWIEMVHPDDKAIADASNKELFERGQSQAEYRIVKPDGSIVWLLDRKALIYDEHGKPILTGGIAKDITERKKLEQQILRTQRMESVGTLAGGIAHDMNNILGPIVLALGVLRKKFTDELSVRMLGMLEGSANRGAALVKQILTFARGTESEKTVIQVRLLIKELQKFVNETFPSNIILSVDVSKDLWTIDADPSQFHQVLLNLAINARDAMPNGGTLTIEAKNTTLDAHYAAMHPEAGPGQYVVVSVSDTGTGIPQEIQQKIFEPFFTTKEIGKGTGLGLATVYSIVKNHGGFINLYSEIGRGTTFKLYFPANVSGETKEQQALQIESLAGHGEYVLVVDDEHVIREVSKLALESNGYNVLLAADGIEALSIFAQHQDKIDLVITDMDMPNMDGPTLIRTLQKMKPSLPIIGASGLADKAKLTEISHLSVSVFLSKPYTAEKLLSAIGDVLHRK